MNIVNIWNYLSDTKKLIGKSNADAEALPLYCTTIEPPAISDGQAAFFNEDSQEWVLQEINPVTVPEVVAAYGFDPVAMTFTGSFNAIADALPSDCTLIAPADSAPAGHVLTFNQSAAEWESTEDHRGEMVYNTADGSAMIIEAPGPYPENTTPLAPAVPFPVWSGSAWVTDTAKQNAANVKENARAYRQLMLLVTIAQCPLTSTKELTEDQQSTLDALQQYAVALSSFVESADLTQIQTFPAAPAGLLDYPLNLNPQFKAQ